MGEAGGAWPTCWAWTTPAMPSRSLPPAATTMLKGAGKTTLADGGCRASCRTLSPQESLELTAIHSLARALEPTDDMITRPPFFAPHRRPGRPARRRFRPGPPPAESRAHCASFPRRVPAVPDRRHRGPAPAAGGARGHHHPRRRVGDLPGRPHGPQRPLALPHLPAPDARQSRCSCTARLPAAGRRPHRRRNRHPAPPRPAEAAPGARSVVDAGEAGNRQGPGRAGAAAAGSAVHRPATGGCNEQAPEPVLRQEWPLARPRSAASTTRPTPAGSAGGVPPGWDCRGRSPTSPGLRTRPARGRHRAAPARRRRAAARDHHPERGLTARGRRRRAAGTSRPRSPRRARVIARRPRRRAGRIHDHLAAKRDVGGMLTDVAARLAAIRVTTWTAPPGWASGFVVPGSAAGSRTWRHDVRGGRLGLCADRSRSTVPSAGGGASGPAPRHGADVAGGLGARFRRAGHCVVSGAFQRPGSPPGRARRRRAERRGAGVRRRPRLPGRPPEPARAPRDDRRRGCWETATPGCARRGSGLAQPAHRRP